MPSPLCFGARTARAGAPSLLPGHLRGLAQTPARPPVFGDMAGEQLPPPPRAPPAPPRLQQPHWRPRAPPEPLGSSGGSFLSRRQCCCVTHMRFPAMLCNGKMAEEKKGARKRRAEPRCCSAGRGRDGRDWRRVRAALPTGLPGIPPSLCRRNPRRRGWAPPGPGRAWRRALTLSCSGPASPAPFFCLFRGRTGIWETPLEREGLWNAGKGHPPCSSPQGLCPHIPDLDGHTSHQPSLGAATFPKAPGTKPLEGDRSIPGDQGVPKQSQPPEMPPRYTPQLKLLK